MDSSDGVLFELLHVIITLFLFLTCSVHADNTPALRSPRICFDGNRAAICGNTTEYPLQIAGAARDICGYPGFEVNCDPYIYRGKLFMNISSNVYHVLDMDYNSQTIRIVDIEWEGQDCPQPKRNFTLPTPLPWVDYYLTGREEVIIFYNCSSVPRNATQRLFCSEDHYRITNTPRSYALYNKENINEYGNCTETVVVPVMLHYPNDFKYRDVIKLGFYMKWSAIGWCGECERSGGQCWSYNSTATGCACKNGKSYNRICPSPTGTHIGLKVIIGVFSGIGGLLLVVVLLVYNKSKIPTYKYKSSIDEKAFMESYKCLALQRYTFSDIKKITNSFKNKLGEGGYGQVFKGKLRDDGLVAVKVLNEFKGDGKDFMNEVATIGRTNHVNVVNLVGFCIEGTKRELVYEFMPNGSLERFIYTPKESITSPPLGWEKLYEIALGIAKGLEYLHRGCNARILHFDIKPHNILLDQDFCPKISDFGLAKVYQTRESIVSTVGARGTMGYIAPELCCRNFGGVSHKSDVYSYGMMMLEMIGGRKNLDITVENSSEIYFPFWIYNHLVQNIDAEGLNDIQAEVFVNEKAKKMSIVALWCIQTLPMERPSMGKVVEMLEGNTHELAMPPNPSLGNQSSSSTSS